MGLGVFGIEGFGNYGVKGLGVSDIQRGVAATRVWGFMALGA